MLIQELANTFVNTIKDVASIVTLIAVFQIFVIKKSIPNLGRVLFGAILVIIGLTFFLIGLEKALFPLGELMAKQLSSPEFLKDHYSGSLTNWQAYYWIYIFAALIGFSTTIAEPSLYAVAVKANEVSGGTIGTFYLRFVVAIGVALALAVGTYRIVVGGSLATYIMVGYIVVIIQTIFVKKDIVALAYDSGGVTTSTVTVPIVAALGLGLASVVPGRNPALDGFGLIAFASVFPIITVLGYAQIIDLITYISKIKKAENRLMKFNLIVALVDPSITEKVVKTAKDSGATGDVIIQGKGSGIDSSSFLGHSIRDKTDIILLIVEEHHTKKIMDTVSEECNIEDPGNGVLIALNIDKVAGFSNQIKAIRENLKTEQL
ncbi:MAG: DUF1538 domain-containing protein [Xanthomonadales bacterium]|nr:DUF1538 domain-containing protein [Xanthomonadales bacterium]